MNQDMVKTVVVIALRHVWPLIGAGGVLSDDQMKQIAGAVVLLGSVAYHAYQRHQGKKVEV